MSLEHRTPGALSLALALVGGCAPCGLESTVPGFAPDCTSAVARVYATETRIAIADDDQVLLVYLPPQVSIGTRYGGTTGNPVTFLLDEQLSISTGSTITLDTLDDDIVEGWLSVRFEAGDLEGGFSGVVSPP